MKNKIGQLETTKKIIEQNKFFIKKKFGQNFLIDQNILNNIVDCAQVTKDTDVIEIGPGLGSLTEIIASRARRVLCYEIDKDLIPILKDNLKDYNNVTILNKDVLKANINADIEEHLDNSKQIYVISNLPYYITTPIILSLLESTKAISRYVMMMQLEVALRICSKPDIKDYNALSVAIQYKTKAEKVMNISSNVFVPKPGVESAVIKLDTFERSNLATDEEFFFKLIRACFAARRKTLLNNLLQFGIDKNKIFNALDNIGISQGTRSENLTVDDFINLSNELTK